MIPCSFSDVDSWPCGGQAAEEEDEEEAKRRRKEEKKAKKKAKTVEEPQSTPVDVVEDAEEDGPPHVAAGWDSEWKPHHDTKKLTRTWPQA